VKKPASISVRRASLRTDPVCIYIDGAPTDANSTDLDNARVLEADAWAVFGALSALPLGTWLALRNLFLMGRIR
jgi:hypothetical protein